MSDYGSAKLPATVISGFLGSGKTTLLKHLLENKQGLRCAVIVNDMAELNIDASLVSSGALVQAEEKLVQLENGCICCTLREDLLRTVREMAAARKFDYLIIESTGISEPEQVAETWYLPVEGGRLSEVATLDTCVTVVDAAAFAENAASLRSLQQRFGEREAVPEGDERSVATLLLDQIEFADVILLNKTDLVPPDAVAGLRLALAALNPAARVLPTVRSCVAPTEVVGTGRFSLERASRNPAWLAALDKPHTPETEEYGIGSFVFRSRRPFHPQRLRRVLGKAFVLALEGLEEEEESSEEEEEESSDDDEDDDEDEDEGIDEAAARLRETRSRLFGGLLRSKGFLWVGTTPKHDVMGLWNQAGSQLSLEHEGPWMCRVPRSLWPADVSRVEKDMDADPIVQDRRQEIVFIGQQLDKDHITATLAPCLLTDDEMAVFADSVSHGRPTPWRDTLGQWPSVDELVAGMDA